jgi:hypothetical protein
LTEFCHCARESLEIFFHTVLGFPDGITGLVMVIHTFGDYARFHPHLHAIVADGLFRIARDDKAGQVLYRSGMTHGRNKKNFEIFPANEFIGRITQHIPEVHGGAGGQVAGN